MPKFSVQYAGADGRINSEEMDAASERAVLARLEAGGFTPISVKSGSAGVKSRSATSANQRSARRVRGTRRAILDFTYQLSAIAESGIPLVAGLKAVAEQTNHPELRAAIARIAGRIEGGRTLADAMDAEPGFFPPIYVKTIAAGETAGKIPEVLNSLANYQEQEAETRAQIRSAMTYPLLVVIALVLAISFMLVFVVPQFAVMFEKFQGQLPLPTRLLMATSKTITQHYFVVLVGLIGIGYSLRTLFTYSFARNWLDHQVLKLPVFGNLFLGVYMVRLIELLDLLTQAALPIVQSLRVTADSMTNAAIEADVRKMGRAVEGGRSLTEAFSEARWLTPLVKRMLAIGEHAGRTDQIFAYLKQYYAKQTQRSVKLLSTLIEPVMVTCLAAVVLFFALAIFLPMWKLLKVIGSA